MVQKFFIYQHLNNKIVILFAIVCTAALLRFINLHNIPPSLSHDEAAIAYNAWSIVQTGKDEYGITFPMLFRSFDDYKLPGYVYSTALSQMVFGNTHFAVRFTSAFLGTLTVLVVYFLAKEIVPSVNGRKITSFPLVSSALFAISPWSINFSRAAFETNASVFFISLALLFLLISRRHLSFLIYSVIPAAAALYFYYTARVLLPVLFVGYIFLHYKYYFNRLRILLVSFLLGCILLMPIIPHMATKGMERINQVSIFNDKSITNPYSQAILRHENSIDSRIIYNRRVAHLQNFSNNYFKNLAPDYYFTNGTGPMGLLYLWEVPFFIFGIYMCFKMKGKNKWIVLFWFFTVPLIAGLTTEQPNPLRTLPAAVPSAIFTGLGLVGFINYFQQKQGLRVIFGLLSLIIVLFFIRFLYLYFDYYPNITAGRWIDGSGNLAGFVKENSGDYDLIYITGENWRPYIHMLYYLDYSPKKYQDEKGSRFGFGNMRFGSAGWDSPSEIRLLHADLDVLKKGKTLFILTKDDYVAQEAVRKINHQTPMKIIKIINGKIVKEAFYAIEI